MATKLTSIKGKRKRAIARATLKPGKGKVRVNNQMIDAFGSKIARMKIQEPLILSGDLSGFDIEVNVKGGGSMSQADAVRLSIARALVKSSKKLEKVFLAYDRHLLVADVRRKESRK